MEREEHHMRKYLEIASACAICALVAGPAMAQTGTTPRQEQQAPRNDQQAPREQPAMNQPGMNQPGGTSHPGMSQPGVTKGEGSTQDSSMRSMKQAGQTSPTQVRRVQQALKAQGHEPGPIDGVMGPQTQEALRAYQKAQNLTETGMLDPQTFEKLGVGGASPRPQQQSR